MDVVDRILAPQGTSEMNVMGALDVPLTDR